MFTPKGQAAFKRTFIASLLAFLSAFPATAESDPKTEGAAQFLLDRANENYLYIVDQRIKDNPLFKEYFPKVHSQLMITDLNMMIHSGKSIWNSAIKDDIEALPLRFFKNLYIKGPKQITSRGSQQSSTINILDRDFIEESVLAVLNSTAISFKDCSPPTDGGRLMKSSFTADLESFYKSLPAHIKKLHTNDIINLNKEDLHYPSEIQNHVTSESAPTEPNKEQQAVKDRVQNCLDFILSLKEEIDVLFDALKVLTDMDLKDKNYLIAISNSVSALNNISKSMDAIKEEHEWALDLKRKAERTRLLLDNLSAYMMHYDAIRNSTTNTEKLISIFFMIENIAPSEDRKLLIQRIYYKKEKYEGTLFKNDAIAKKHDKYYEQFKRYALFFAQAADAANADKPEDVKALLKAFTMPPVSFALKRKPKEMHITISSYLGLAGGGETEETDHTVINGYYGLFAPVGLEWSYGTGRRRSHAVFIPVMEFGPAVNNELYETERPLELNDLIAPGLFYVKGLKDWPLAWGIGAQYAKGITSEGPVKKYETRFLIFFAFDMPLYTIY